MTRPIGYNHNHNKGTGMTPTVVETLERIYDELDGIAGGEVNPHTAKALERAMGRVEFAIMIEKEDEA